jgi:hypothetical protein
VIGCHEKIWLSLAIAALFWTGCDAWVTFDAKVVGVDGKPITNATATISQGSSKIGATITDENGVLHFHENIAPGPLGSREITIEVKKPTYRTATVVFDWKIDGKNDRVTKRTIVLEHE